MVPPLGRRVHHRARAAESPRGSQHLHGMNRVSEYFEKSPEENYGDFYVVAGEYFTAGVTRETAERIEAVLDRKSVPKWVEFHDRSGSRFRVRTRLIRTIIESTAEQRAADRRYERARQREEKEDRRPWDD
jgi:hypothetical protein